MRYSVIISAYNTEAYIGRCLDSVLNQEYDKDEFEVIVIDDHSPDNLGEIVKEKQSAHKNLTYYRSEINKNCGGGRNIGVKFAKGEYIFFLDSDDYWVYNNVFSTFDKILKRGNFDLVSSTSHVDIYSPDEFRYGNYNNDIAQTLKTFDSSSFICAKEFDAYVPFTCYRRDFIADISFREHCYFEDGDYRLRTIIKANQIGVIDFPFYAYVNNPTSIIRLPKIEVFRDNIICNLKILEITDNSDLSKEAKAARYNRTKNNFYSYIRISRDYKIRDSVNVLKLLKDTPMTDTKRYHFTGTAEKLKFLTFKHCAPLVVTIVRILTITKRTLLSKLRHT
jgi:glycosyltransferase involved in cell wall biosynthesis